MKYVLLIFLAPCLIFADSLIVGIAGGSGSGKSTIAQRLQEGFGDQAIVINQDAYYKHHPELTYDERRLLNFDEPNALDFALLIEHVKALKSEQAIEKPIYNFDVSLRQEGTIHIEPTDIVIVEGGLLFTSEELVNLIDIRLFLDVDIDISLLRRIERDQMERAREFGQIIEQYLSTVRPMYHKWIAPSKVHADLIIPNHGDYTMTVRLLFSAISSETRVDHDISRFASLNPF